MAEPARQHGQPPEHDEDVSYLPVPVAQMAVEAPAARPIELAQAAASPATVAAAGGFLVGLATIVLARVLSRGQGRRSLPRVLPRRRGRGAIEVAGSRSFLVDVHMLRR